jgi:hypothetical protein
MRMLCLRLKLICGLLAFLVSESELGAQQKGTDTLLNMVLSEPFFYNVVGGVDGSIYVGTSKGIFQLSGKDLKPVSQDRGYVTLAGQGRPVISETGILNYRERKFLHLLPYPEQSRDEFHSGTPRYFYICSGGRLYIFDILPYQYSYPNHSIRTITNQFVGTYSGIYRKGVRLNPKVFPHYVDGYIREINGKAFICYDYLLTIDLKDTLNNMRTLHIGDEEKGGIRDIVCSPVINNYIVFFTNCIYSADSSFAQKKIIYRSLNNKKNITYIGTKVGSNQNLFTDDNFLLGIQGNAKIDTLANLKDPILAGTVVGLHTFLLSGTALYIYYHNKSIEKIGTSLKKAHSLIALSETELIISSDEGLYSLNTVTKELSPLITGIEFNRRALYIENDKIFAGSINGLYTLNVSRLKEISTDIVNSQNNANTAIPIYVYVGIATFLLTILILVFFLLRTRKEIRIKTRELHELNPILIDREKIVEFISNNLPNASLKSIAEHFNTNNSYIYRLLAPDKPGTIISQIRKEVVEKMKKEGKSAAEISITTGLSRSYISKI